MPCSLINSLFKLIFDDFGPCIINSWYPTFVNSLKIGVCKDQVVCGLQRDLIHLQRLYSVKNEYLEFFNLIKKFFFNFLLVLVKILDVSLFICGSDHSKAIPLLEKALYQVSYSIFLSNFLTKAFSFLQTRF
jgi:hypothetical protein